MELTILRMDFQHGKLMPEEPLYRVLQKFYHKFSIANISSNNCRIRGFQTDSGCRRKMARENFIFSQIFPFFLFEHTPKQSHRPRGQT